MGGVGGFATSCPKVGTAKIATAKKTIVQRSMSLFWDSALFKLRRIGRLRFSKGPRGYGKGPVPKNGSVNSSKQNDGSYVFQKA